MLEMHTIITGNVQDVGFRAFAKQAADHLHIAGFARNLPDGSVEMCAQGERKALEELLNLLLSEFEAQTEVRFSTPQEIHSGFRIL